MKRTECIDKINNFISNEEVRNFIFNFTNRESRFLTTKNDILYYLSNILVLASSMLYSRYVEWKNKSTSHNKFIDFTNSMIRLYNSLEKIYDSSIVTFEYIDDLMMNLQIDCALNYSNGENSFLNKIGLGNNYFDFENRFSKVVYEIQRKRESTRYTSSIGYDDLIEFIKMFPFLNRIDLSYKPISNLYYNKEISKGLKEITIVFNEESPNSIYNKELELNYFLISNKEGLHYFLEKITVYDEKFGSNKKEKQQIVYLEYVEINRRLKIALTNLEETVDKINEEYVVIDKTGVEDLLLYFDITKYNIHELTDNYFFKDFHSFNNRYLKNLGLIISDCLSTKIKEGLLQKYGEKYKNVFSKLKIDSLAKSVWSKDNYDWDAIITILLLEEGVYKIIKTILSLDDNVYENIKKQFYQRIVDIDDKVSKKTKMIIDNPTYNLLPSDLEFKKMEVSCKSDALVRLAMELFGRKSEIAIENIVLPANMDQRIKNLKKMYISNRSTEEKINYFLKSTEQTTKMVLVFLKSFIEYIKKISIINSNFIIEEKEIKKVKNDAIDSFINSVKNLKLEYVNLNYCKEYDSKYFLNEKSIKNGKFNINKIFNLLKEFNEECSKPESIENKSLRKVIGKANLIDKDDLEKIIVEYNNFFDLLLDDTSISKEEVMRIYQICVKYFRYLQSGSLELDYEYDPEKAVYPLLGIYTSGITSRDGYLSSYFIIDMPDSDEKRIKVLSDDIFEFQDEYFCIPNLNRIAKFSEKSEELWVSPVIINCKHFSKNYFATYCEGDHAENDYDKISELIYNTDIHIYGALFGNLENAKKVLKILFEKPDNMFSIDKYVTVKEDKDVIAVGSIYTSATKWDQNIVSQAMMQAGIKKPESFEFGCSYFKDTYNDINGKDRSLICDICVEEKHRNKGVGKFLLMNIIKNASAINKDLLITVYANNYAAVNLYKSLDFIEYESFMDPRVYNREQELCLKMIRFSDI